MSPYSVATALGLLSVGAQGRTFNQISSALHVNGNHQTIANAFGYSLNELRNKIGYSTLNIANKIFVRNGLQINPDYKIVAVNQFHSDIENTNFADSFGTARKINQWIEEKTNNKIKNLVDPGTLSGGAQLVLVNAIYFKGAWEKPFPDDTIRNAFRISGSQTRMVNYMYQKNHFLHKRFDNLGFTALRMKYSNSDASMLILLPNKVNALRELEAKLHTFDLKSITDRMTAEEITVIFPKFKIEFEVGLSEALEVVSFSFSSDLC